jgi:hypothetical protein
MGRGKTLKGERKYLSRALLPLGTPSVRIPLSPSGQRLLGPNLHCLFLKTPHFIFVMKLSGSSTLLALLLSSSVAYATGTRDVFQARQAHAKRSLVDVCAALDLDVDVGLGST